MVAGDQQVGIQEGLAGPCNDAAAVAPSDTDDLSFVTRGLYVGGAGAVSVVMQGGQTVLISGIVAGSILPIRVTRVRASGTTATLMVALW